MTEYEHPYTNRFFGLALGTSLLTVVGTTGTVAAAAVGFAFDPSHDVGDAFCRLWDTALHVLPYEIGTTAAAIGFGLLGQSAAGDQIGRFAENIVDAAAQKAHRLGQAISQTLHL